MRIFKKLIIHFYWKIEDLLTITIFEMTYDGERMSLDEVKKQLEIK